MRNALHTEYKRLLGKQSLRETRDEADSFLGMCASFFCFGFLVVSWESLYIADSIVFIFCVAKPSTVPGDVRSDASQMPAHVIPNTDT